MNKKPIRCFGNKDGQELYATYHDKEWGKIIKDDQSLFEMLTLEGAQAGLSFYTILKKREGYRQVFHNFDVKIVSSMTDEELNSLMNNSNIVRHKNKIFSVRKNALVFLNIQKEFGSFYHYLWSFVDFKQVINHYESFKEVPTKTVLSDTISKDLKKRGMSYVGSTIMYAYLQAVGVIDDHLNSCHIRRKNENI